MRHLFDEQHGHERLAAPRGQADDQILLDRLFHQLRLNSSHTFVPAIDHEDNRTWYACGTVTRFCALTAMSLCVNLLIKRKRLPLCASTKQNEPSLVCIAGRHV